MTLNSRKVFEEIKDSYSYENCSLHESIIICGDSLQLLKKIPNHSIALIITDPPYHSTKKKNIIGDTSFGKDIEYVEWMREYASEWKRILKPNGSVFCFCASAMSAQLQIMFADFFNVLSEITWTKP
ncbi:MAG: DNA methyltransferase, partial [Methanomassiliicoccales archaeon]